MKTRFTLLVTVFIGLILTRDILGVPVTFQVDMGVQQETGAFDPAVHTVEVRGSFDSWGAGAVLTQSTSDPTLYQGSIDIAGSAGTQVQYKFVMNQAGTLVWENDGVGPGGAQNRAFNLEQTAQTLPAVNFNNQTSAPRVVPVTFQVNVEIQRAIGNFNPATDTVEVRGSFDNWGAGMMLEASTTNENVYKGTMDITGSPGAPIDYKFVINHDGTQVWEGNVGVAGGLNRSFSLAESAQLLPVVYFDNLSVDPGAGVTVTFRVNMSVQEALGMFDPAIGTMSVAGQFNNWNVTATPLTNSTAEPLVYSGTVNIKAAAGSTVPFKFVANDGTWETGDNRTFSLQGPNQILPTLFFNNQTGVGTLSIARASATEVRVSWTAANATVRLQTAANVGAVWQDVPASEGVDSMSFTSNEGRQFFRLISP